MALFSGFACVTRIGEANLKPEIRLPKRGHIKPIDREGPLPFYYRPITRAVYRQRLVLACDLLGAGHFGRILDAGYGSGILLPELSTRSDTVFGLDLHDKIAQVRQMLTHEGVQATALACSWKWLLRLPPVRFGDGSKPNGSSSGDIIPGSIRSIPTSWRWLRPCSRSTNRRLLCSKIGHLGRMR